MCTLTTGSVHRCIAAREAEGAQGGELGVGRQHRTQSRQVIRLPGEVPATTEAPQRGTAHQLVNFSVNVNATDATLID